MGWRITDVSADDEGFCLVELEREPGECASAQVVVTDRNRREPHGGWDPKVAVLECDNDSAEAWLEAAEHEYEIAELCAGGAVRRAS